MSLNFEGNAATSTTRPQNSGFSPGGGKVSEDGVASQTMPACPAKRAGATCPMRVAPPMHPSETMRCSLWSCACYQDTFWQRGTGSCFYSPPFMSGRTDYVERSRASVQYKY